MVEITEAASESFAASLSVSFFSCHCFTRENRSDLMRGVAAGCSAALTSDLICTASVCDGSLLSQLIVSSKNSKPLSSKTKKFTAFSETSHDYSSLENNAFVLFDSAMAVSKPMVSSLDFLARPLFTLLTIRTSELRAILIDSRFWTQSATSIRMSLISVVICLTAVVAGVCND